MGWGGACSHSYEVARCGCYVAGLGWGGGGVGHVRIHVKLHTLWVLRFMCSCARCGCYVHCNGNVSTLTAKTLRKLAWRKDAWTRLFRCSETRNHPENGPFSIIDIDTLRSFRWGETTKIFSLYCKSHATMQDWRLETLQNPWFEARSDPDAMIKSHWTLSRQSVRTVVYVAKLSPPMASLFTLQVTSLISWWWNLRKDSSWYVLNSVCKPFM